MAGRDELVSLLAQTLGMQKAIEVVDETARRVKVTGADYSPEQMMLILDDLATQKGTTGIVARFAKVRLILNETGVPAPASVRQPVSVRPPPNPGPSGSVRPPPPNSSPSGSVRPPPPDPGPPASVRPPPLVGPIPSVRIPR